jgi:hypothetical protein
MSIINSFKDLPYDIYLKIANAAVEDLVDDSLPYFALRLICPGFTPFICQCIMDKMDTVLTYISSSGKLRCRQTRALLTDVQMVRHSLSLSRGAPHLHGL